MNTRSFSPDAAGGTGTGAAGVSGAGATGAGGTGQNQQGAEGQEQGQGPETFETWLGQQPKEHQDRYNAGVKGLKTSLEDVLADRKALKKQLTDLAGKAEKGSELETKLNDSLAKIEETDRRADFYDAAHSAGVTNLKLAYLVAVQDEFFDKKGNVNFETLKSKYPELFSGKSPLPKGNAGAGTGGDDKPAIGMNEVIRRAAGRR